MGLLTLNIPSFHTKIPDSLLEVNVALTVTTNVCFCPIDVNERTDGKTLILSPVGAAMTAV